MIMMMRVNVLFTVHNVYVYVDSKTRRYATALVNKQKIVKIVILCTNRAIFGTNSKVFEVGEFKYANNNLNEQRELP